MTRKISCLHMLPFVFGLFLGTVSQIVPAAEHVCGRMTIGVELDSQPFMTERDYQIDVVIDGLTVSRLNAPLVGDTLVSYAADLLGDSFCDVVIVSEGGTGQEIYLDVYEWAEHRLQPIKLAALPNKSSLDEIASSTMSVVDNRLMFLTQSHLNNSEMRQSADKLVGKLFYSFDTKEWVGH
jgi:hypothetical protein